MNLVILKGRFVRNIEIINTSGGSIIGKSSIAVNDNYKDTKKTYFINTVCFGKTAETISKYFSKGSEILITGKLTQNTWNDKDGKKKSSIEVVINSFDFCGNKEKSQQVEIVKNSDDKPDDKSDDIYNEFGDSISNTDENNEIF